MYTVNWEIFARILFSRLVLKDMQGIYDVKNTLLVHDLHIWVNDRVISNFREGFVFAFAKFRGKKSSWKFPILQ